MMFIFFIARFEEHIGYSKVNHDKKLKTLLPENAFIFHDIATRPA